MARQEGRDHVDRIEVEAAAEVAADRRLDNADAISGNAEALGQVALVEEGRLGRGPHREAPLDLPRGPGPPFS